jgi:hypothetical protein
MHFMSWLHVFSKAETTAAPKRHFWVNLDLCRFDNYMRGLQTGRLVGQPLATAVLKLHFRDKIWLKFNDLLILGH